MLGSRGVGSRGADSNLLLQEKRTSQYLDPSPYIIVRLSTPTLAWKVLSAKKVFTCFKVGDLNKALLEPEMNLAEPECKICINEALSLQIRLV